MYKYLISIFLVLNSFLIADYEDNSPQKTTHEDLEILKDFEKLLYSKTSILLNECKQNEIISFIELFKAEEFEYNKLLVNLNSQVSSTDNFNDTDGSYRDRDKSSIQLAATYPIFDKKTDIEISKKKLQYKSSLIDDVSKYCELKNKLDVIKHEIDLLNLKQIRAKAREDTGQIYLDDRITLIEEIIKKKNDFSKTTIDFNTMKLQLLNKVKASKEEELKGLL
jgi:hypothetical protein